MITEITAFSSVPTCSDEGVHSINDVIEIGEKLITSGLSLKTIKLGGAYEAYKCGEKANELGLNKKNITFIISIEEINLIN